MTRVQWRSIDALRQLYRFPPRFEDQRQRTELNWWIHFSNLDKTFPLIFFFFVFFFVTDNELICDCRLAWIFDLKNRTKNFELRYSLEEIECMMKTKDRPTAVRIKVNVDDVMKKQILNEETEYYDDESYDEKRTTQLMQFKQRDLPCPQQYREQLEHPSTREFIGFDLSWIGSSATRIHQLKTVLFLALTTHFACTLAAYLR